VALFGGPDGLKAIEGALDAARRSLRRGGWLIMEFGYGQEDALAALVEARREFRLDRVRADYQDIPRTAVIERT
jgi:methylase of polypeptide subunit release factors